MEGCEWPRFLFPIGITSLDGPYVEYLWVRVLLPMREFGEALVRVCSNISIKKSYMMCSIAQKLFYMEGILSCSLLLGLDKCYRSYASI